MCFSSIIVSGEGFVGIHVCHKYFSLFVGKNYRAILSH